MVQVKDPLPAAEELVAARLADLTHDQREACLVFPHALVQVAVDDSLGPAYRSTLHRAAADVTRGTVSLFHRSAAAIYPDPSLAAALEKQAELDRSAGSWRAAATSLLGGGSAERGERPPR